MPWSAGLGKGDVGRRGGATEFLSLLIYPDMTDAHVEEVSAAVRTFFEEAG